MNEPRQVSMSLRGVGVDAQTDLLTIPTRYFALLQKNLSLVCERDNYWANTLSERDN